MRLLPAVALCFVVSSCTSAQQVDEQSAAEVRLRKGAYLSGKPTGLGAPQVINRRDFVYALAFGDDDVVAFTHHVTTSMELTSTALEPRQTRFQQPVNSSEFDVEDVVILDVGPGRGTVAVPSRQGIARSFHAKTGALSKELITGVPLIRVAASPDGALLAFGSADGRVLLVDAGTFTIRGQARLHDDEVHGLAFLKDGRLVSSSFDGTLKVAELVPATDATVRSATTTLKSGERVFLAHLTDASGAVRAVATVRDTRQPSCAMTTAAAKRLSLQPTEGGALVPVVTATEAKDAAGVALGSLSVQTLDLGALNAGVCDACVPEGAELVLGATALSRASFIDDIARDEVIVQPTAAAAGGGNVARLSAGALALVPRKQVTLPGPSTDLDVSRTGAVLVAFGTTRAQRSYEINHAEKDGAYPAPAPTSGAALIDVDSEQILRTFAARHHGVTSTAALSPDGRSVVTGGWDKRVLVFDATTGETVTEREVAWLVRRVRFSPDGRLLGVAAWTPVNALNDGDSEPSLLVYPVALAGASVQAPAR